MEAAKFDALAAKFGAAEAKFEAVLAETTDAEADLALLLQPT